MKRLVGTFFLIFGLFLNSFSQNKDTLNVNLTNFKLFPGSTFSWRGTNTYYDMTSFDSSPFTEGILKQKSGANWLFRMNYRLLYPGGKADKSGWDPNYQPGYPIIVFLHGGGERGNCWNGTCYCGTNNGCAVNGTPIAGTDLRFLNNDNQIGTGGQTHLSSVVLAGTKKPDDLTLDGRAFPGFLLYPQNVNAWGNDNSASSDLSYAIRIVRLLVKQLNIDPNRIYIHGLSLGGQGVYKAMNMADWLWACSLTMSGLDYQQGLEYDSVSNIPLWVFQGGQDTQVTPSQSASLVKQFRQAGGNARYTLYPTLGHGTWNTAYAEPDFFTWILSHNKANIHVPFGNPNICGTTGAGVNLTLAQGFYAYQWERDGQIIAGATSYQYMANIPGIYRARFSRVTSNPTETQWNRWSDPVTIGEKTPDVPLVDQVGTIVLSDLNNNKNATLTGPDGFEHYYWYKNGDATTLLDQQTANISGCSATTSCANTGAYTLVTAGFDLCPSPVSKAKYVVMGVNNSTITPPVITAKPTNLVGRVISPSTILFTWNDNSKDERGYELWRRTSTDATTTPWKLAVLTNEDVTQFYDTGLQPNTTYYYKIRAVNNSGRSDYFPGNSATTLAQHYVISTGTDTQKPTPPQNLVATVTGIQTISLTWTAATDESGIKDYYVYYGTDSILMGSANTTYVFGKTQLLLNTIYNFTVRAVDLYGNVSSKSSQVSANTYVDGLYYEHSTGAWTDITKIPWTTAVPEFTGKVSNLTLAGPPPLGPRTQDDYFNFRFYGYLYITKAGSYTFNLYSNDGAEFFLDGVSRKQRKGTVADGSCTNNTTSSISLAANSYHYIEVRYYDYTGSQCLDLKYKGPDPGNTYVSIPDSKLKSYNVITPPVAPLAVTNLTATAVSMSQIDLTWSVTETLPVNYEVYRSTSLAGTYSMIGRVTSTSLSDVGLTPGTPYYYKIKTVNDNGTSAFSSVATATTLSDTQAPTQPTALSVTASTFTTVSLVWTASTDNVKVTGYEIWANGLLVGTSSISGYLATSLTPSTTYNFSVIAYDASGNKSTASNVATTSTSSADVYYSNASGALNVPATWGKNSDGSGVLATSFSNNGQYFIVSNRTTSSLGGQWSVDGSISKVIVPSGVTLTVDNTFTARTEVQANATININSAYTPQFISLAPTSTVNYNYTNLGNAYVQQNTYGNLGLYGTGNKVFASGTTTVLGNITGDAGIAFKGAPDNTTKLIVQGDITVNGAPAFTAPDFGIDLELSKSGTQTMTASGDLYFEKITLTGAGNTLNVLNGGTPFSINVGTFNGGGVTILAGATLNLNANNIVLAKNSAINGNNETGRIAISGGTLDLTSTSSLNSNLYFSPTNHSAKQLSINLTGSGKAMVREAMEVTSGIKIKNGELNSAGNITMISNAAGTANLQEIEGTGILTGNVNVQRYIDSKGIVYRYISASVAGTTAGNWETFFPLTGAFVCYEYVNEAWVRYATTTPTSQYPIEKGRGYSVYLRNGASPINMHVAGNPYQGNISLPLDPDPSSASTDGWNLVGNPYASTITWGNTGWIRSAGINNTISVRNNPAGVFLYYDYTTGLGTLTGGKITPGQAFWVQVTTSNPSLIITEKAKSTELQSLFREQTNPVSHITLSLQQGTKEDAAFIAFTDFGTDAQDQEYDAVKQINPGQFSFSSLTSNKVSAAINNMSNSFCSKTTKLNIEYAPAGSYSLIVSEVESLGTIGQIVLKDNYTKTNTPISEGSIYNFTISSDTASYGASRFSLQISRPDLTLTSKATADNVCNLDSAVVTLSNTQEGVSYYAVNGANKKISDTYTGTGADLFIMIPKENLIEGANAISLTAGFNGCETQTLPVSLNVNYSTTPVVATEQSVTGCQGSTVKLEASGAPSGGSYKWYDSNQNEITGVTGNSFETSTLQDQVTYYVSALSSSGCESSKMEIDVTGQALDIPTLNISNDTLFATSNNFIQWYRNGERIDGATGLFFIPQLDGEYTVESDQNGCLAESNTVQYGNSITGTGASPDGDLRLLVYPNPAPRTNVNFKINSNSSADVHVQLVDLLGKTSFSKSMNITEAEDGYKLETSVNLKNGVYFIIINQDNKTIKKKLVVLD